VHDIRAAIGDLPGCVDAVYRPG